jgi:hypothetical protein
MFQKVMELFSVNWEAFAIGIGVIGGCKVKTAHIDEEGVDELPVEAFAQMLIFLKSLPQNG